MLSVFRVLSGQLSSPVLHLFCHNRLCSLRQLGDGVGMEVRRRVGASIMWMWIQGGEHKLTLNSEWKDGWRFGYV